MDNTNRFDGKGEIYAKARPKYAKALFAYLKEKLALSTKSVFADIGSGTGIFTEQLLVNCGCPVFAVEPNSDMRKKAEEKLSKNKKFISVDGSASSTNLPDKSVDYVTVAQAFHWFEPEAFKKECKRILRPEGKVILVYNSRDEKSDVTKALAKLRYQYNSEFHGFSNGMSSEKCIAFFHGACDVYCTDNTQRYDRQGYINRVLSSSYSLKENDQKYDEYITDINKIFDAFSENGVIAVPTNTVVYIGKIDELVERSDKKASRIERITPAQAGLDPRCIINMMDRMEKEHINLTSFLLLRHGKVLCEAFYEPYMPDQLRTVYSLSKTFTSMAIGIAAGEGKIDLDEKITDLFAEEIEEGKIPVGKELASLTVRHLLRMSTGQENEPNGGDSDWDDMASAFLRTPFHEMPGEVFRYNTMATYMLSASLKKKGIDLETYLEEKLLTPMGISGTRWLRDPRGICTGGFGFSLYTEVIAKLGQMILQGGVWNGKQLVSKEYIDMATAKQIENGDDPNSDWAQGYGYQMWRCCHNAVRGDGMYGQFCVIHKETDTVLAMTAVTSDMQTELKAYFDEVLLHYQDEPFPENEEAMEKLKARLASLHYMRPLPEDDGSVVPSVLKKINLPLTNFFDLSLSIEGDTLTLTDKEGEVRYQAERGKWSKICRKVHCTPFYTEKDTVATPVIGAWGMKEDSLIIKLYEIEFLEEDTITLTPKEGGVQVSFSNTTIPSQVREYVSTVLSKA